MACAHKDYFVQHLQPLLSLLIIFFVQHSQTLQRSVDSTKSHAYSLTRLVVVSISYLQRTREGPMYEIGKGGVSSERLSREMRPHG